MTPDILSAIESISEHPASKHVTICIRVETSEQVDELYVSMGEPVGKRARFERPHDDFTSDALGYERKAMTTIKGNTTVIVTGPMEMARRVA